MKDIQNGKFIPLVANQIQGTGAPVIMIHGLAASLHDWDDLVPELTSQGFACYTPDLLGHGDSPKPDAPAYRMEWVLDHFFNLMQSLHLTEPAILIGHSLGGYVALEYARRVPASTRGLILVNPFYSRSQLPFFLRNTYAHPRLSGWVVSRMPQWLFRFFVDVSSVAMGHSIGALHSLPERVRIQTALDFKRTAPGVYHIPNAITDLDEVLHDIHVPTLVLWGDHDKTLAPSSFARLVQALPKARAKLLQAGHVPHQSHASEFNRIVLRFLSELP